MQIYAYDKNGDEVISHFAETKTTYFCPECHHPVRLRSGPFLRPHFFHLKNQAPCRLREKGETHLQIQDKLLQLLPKNEAFLERRLPSINRIADVVWETQKLIFEVQVSFISAEEVLARISAYRSQGYEVVWILHKRRFLNYRVTAAELALQTHTHYFTDITEHGHGVFFDQFSYILGGVRGASLFLRPVDLSKPQQATPSPNLPPRLLKMRAPWTVSFAGDLLNSSHFSPRHLEKALALEELEIQPRRRFSLIKKIKDTLKLLAYALLDTGTR